MKRCFFAALGVVLMLNLCACAAQTPAQPPAEEPAVSAPAEPSAPVEETEKAPEPQVVPQPEVLPLEPWTDEDVLELLGQYNANFVEFQDVGQVRLVRYEQEYDLLHALALVDYQARTLVPLTGGLMPEAKVGAADNDPMLNGLYILHTGTNPHGPQKEWPMLEHLWLPQNEITPLYSYRQPYLMSREQSFAVGHHTGARVERLTLGHNRICFEFLDDGGLFVGGGPLTPCMEVSFEGDECTVFFPNTVLDEFFRVVEEQEDSQFTPVFLSAEDTWDGAILKFDCGLLYQHDGEDRQTRWYIEEDDHPITDLPRATVCFEAYWPENYPEGW